VTIRRSGGDRGSVVAEFAIALPAVMLVLVLGASVLAAGAQHVRLQDAAADAARLLARGESDGRARSAIAASADGAAMSVQRGDGLVCVEATGATVAGLSLRARSCALEGGW